MMPVCCPLLCQDEVINFVATLVRSSDGVGLNFASLATPFRNQYSMSP